MKNLIAILLLFSSFILSQNSEDHLIDLIALGIFENATDLSMVNSLEELTEIINSAEVDEIFIGKSLSYDLYQRGGICGTKSRFIIFNRKIGGFITDPETCDEISILMAEQNNLLKTGDNQTCRMDNSWFAVLWLKWNAPADLLKEAALTAQDILLKDGINKINDITIAPRIASLYEKMADEKLLLISVSCMASIYRPGDGGKIRSLFGPKFFADEGIDKNLLSFSSLFFIYDSGSMKEEEIKTTLELSGEYPVSIAIKSHGEFFLIEKIISENKNLEKKSNITLYQTFEKRQHRRSRRTNKLFASFRPWAKYPVAGEANYEKTGPQGKIFQSAGADMKEWDFAISPVIGYDPTIGFVLGGAIFTYPLGNRGFSSYLRSNVTFSGEFEVVTSFGYYGYKDIYDFSCDLEYSTIYEYYYGEGNAARERDSGKSVYADVLLIKPELSLWNGKKTRLSFFSDIRTRHENKIMDYDSEKEFDIRLIPDEFTAAAGVSFSYDTRDRIFPSNTRLGTFATIFIQYLPASFSDLEGRKDVWQAGFEARNFRYFSRPDLILALRLKGGVSSDDPGYMFRYRLGGLYSMRGNYYNRYRGSHYYTGTVELRFPVWSYFSGAVFTDFGDVADNNFSDFRHPQVTGGLGIRFGLPPSGEIKLRLDAGFRKYDGGFMSMAFTFGEVF